jgi:peroxiredoxin Q/BCP
MAAKRAPALAQKKSVSSPKPAPKAAKGSAKAAPAAKPTPKKAAAAAKPVARKAAAAAKPAPKAAKGSAKAVPAAKPAPKKALVAAKRAPAKAPAKNVASPAKATSASNGKRPAASDGKKPSASNGKQPSASKAMKAAPAKAEKPKSTGKLAKAVSGGLGIGDSVPDLELADHEGKPFALGSLGGQSYVLYFYPKDDTPGCTREACTFRDDLGKYEGHGVRIIGISPDKPESHARFRSKYGLPFTLLSDSEKIAANAFGVWVKKQNYGREYMGIERSTFFVDPEGKVKKIWRNVKVDGHSQSILDAASS